MRQESLRQSDRIWSELTAAEGWDCRLLQFNREEKQRYQWLTTAVSASAREWHLMDGEHDIGDVSTVQPDKSLEDIWYFTTHVQSAQIVLTWHPDSFISKKCRGHVSFLSKIVKCVLSHLTDKKNKYMTLSWLREHAQEGESDNTFPYALIISSLWCSFCLDS